MSEQLRTKDFPPGWGHIQVPMTSRRTALAALALYTPSRRTGALLQRGARGAVRLMGPRALPGGASVWEPPMPAAVWERLTSEWRMALGPWEEFVPYHRRQGREGAIVLLLDRRGPLAFLKAFRAADSIEATALRAVEAFDPTTFSAPRVLGEGTEDGWTWVAMTPLPPKPHRMEADPPLEAILAEITEALAPLPRTEGTPEHWQPAHGDFTPWNLRSIRGGGRWLLDWEDAAWAPPQADKTLYLAAAAALQRPVEGRAIAPGEAADYWWDKVSRRADERQRRGGSGSEQRGAEDLERRMLEALRATTGSRS